MKYNESDTLICTKSYSNPDTGKKLFVKNRTYFVDVRGENIYEIFSRNGSVICKEKFIDEHFIKEEK